jgi:hypothetical protein
MDWAYKAVLTAAAVAAVMMAARLFGRSVAGLLAGLPVITAPALLWLAAEQGDAFAAASAVGSLAACVPAALFAWTFERLARRRGGAKSLLGALLVLAASAVVTLPLAGHALPALLAALLVCGVALRSVSARPACSSWVRPLRGEPWLSALLAGVVSAGVALVAQMVGAFWAGMLSSLPIISACAMLHLRLAGGSGDVTRFVTGYLPGLLAKAVFVFAFALLAPRLGSLAALGLAMVAGAAGAALLARARRGPRVAEAAGGSAAAAAGLTVRTVDPSADGTLRAVR